MFGWPGEWHFGEGAEMCTRGACAPQRLTPALAILSGLS
jgi:hypothetical protein